MENLSFPASRRKRVQQLRELLPVFVTLFANLGWLTVVRLAAITLFTYAQVTSNARFGEIAEQLHANELTIIGIGAALFPLLLVALSPVTWIHWVDLFPRKLVKSRITAPLLEGAILAMLVAFSLFASGYYQWVGIGFQGEDLGVQLVQFLLRTLAVIGIAWGEGFVFLALCHVKVRRTLGNRAAHLIIALLFAATQFLFFDLGWAQLGSLCLLFWLAAEKTAAQEDYLSGTALLFGFFALLHLGFGMSILGADGNGLLNLRYLGPASGQMESWSLRWTSGGFGGPLSSLVLQFTLGVRIWMKTFPRQGLPTLKPRS